MSMTGRLGPNASSASTSARRRWALIIAASMALAATAVARPASGAATITCSGQMVASTGLGTKGFHSGASAMWRIDGPCTGVATDGTAADSFWMEGNLTGWCHDWIGRGYGSVGARSANNLWLTVNGFLLEVYDGPSLIGQGYIRGGMSCLDGTADIFDVDVSFTFV